MLVRAVHSRHRQKTGKAFDKESDLDWSAISAALFVKCVGEFTSWAGDYKEGHVRPRNPTEKEYWDKNLSICPGNIQRGFIDPYKTPTWERYTVSQLIGDAMWRLTVKCETTVGSPRFKKSTIRIYRDWQPSSDN